MATLLSELITEGNYKSDGKGGEFPTAVYSDDLRQLIEAACPELDQDKLTKDELLIALAKKVRGGVLARTLTLEMLLEMAKIRGGLKTEVLFK